MATDFEAKWTRFISWAAILSRDPRWKARGLDLAKLKMAGRVFVAAQRYAGKPRLGQMCLDALTEAASLDNALDEAEASSSRTPAEIEALENELAAAGERLMAILVAMSDEEETEALEDIRRLCKPPAGRA